MKTTAFYAACSGSDIPPAKVSVNRNHHCCNLDPNLHFEDLQTASFTRFNNFSFMALSKVNVAASNFSSGFTQKPFSVFDKPLAFGRFFTLCSMNNRIKRLVHIIHLYDFFYDIANPFHSFLSFNFPSPRCSRINLPTSA